MMQLIDATGLTPEQVHAIEVLVNGYRQQSATAPSGPPPGETPEEWLRRLKAWTESHPKRNIEIDDDRETIYAGRGE